MTRTTAGAINASAVSNQLQINLIDDGLLPEFSGRQVLCTNKSFSFATFSNGYHEFAVPNEPVPYRIIVKPNFSSGDLYLNLAAVPCEGFYPFQSMGIVFFSNWLATYGDLILHAAGIAYEGEGYAFAGSSGMGKSTLVENLGREEGVSILGEDQVILRYLDGNFWIFGTPWHERPERCAAMGVPLKRLFFLDRNNPKVLTRISPIDAVIGLMKTAFLPYYRKKAVPQILDRLDLLVDTLPSFCLSYELCAKILPIIIN